jgi:hypothetical protein
MWWIVLIAGIGLVLVGARMRWKVESATEGKGPGFMWPDLLILVGLLAAIRTIQHEMEEETGGEWIAAGLLGLALVVAGLKMRTSGQKIAWGWGDGPVKNSTRTGKALFLLGALYVLFAVAGILNTIRFG